jgi:adenylyl-sulfate kinase
MAPYRKTVWFTGLSGSGKSTLSVALSSVLRSRGLTVRILDGDALRRGLCSDLGFSQEDRDENIRRLAHVAQLFTLDYDVVLVAALTPLQTQRDSARSILPDLLEVFVDAPLEICECRDPKGLYEKARRGLVTNFTGIDSVYEPPTTADVVCRTDLDDVSTCVEGILTMLRSNGIASI